MSRRNGYVVDVTYPLHFYKEMQPTWLTYVLNTLGCVAPDISKSYTYCELGCGAGINTLVAAACNPIGKFVGVDFNQQHIAQARAVAKQAGIKNVSFIEASFEEFVKQDHDKFDFIASHGVWSWLPPQAKRAMLQVIYERLVPQGVLYLQYMCYPGAARLIGLQKVLHEVSLANGSGSVESVLEGIALLRKLANSGAGLFVDNPEIEKELTALERERPDYLAHDFLTDYWLPEHSADVHKLIAQTGTSYVGSANCFENMDMLSIPGNVQPLVAQAASRSLKETLRDIARNQNQRVDIFQKNPKSLGSDKHLATLSQHVFTSLDTMPSKGNLVFQTPIGKIPAPEEIFTPLIEKLQGGNKSFENLMCLPIFKQEPGLLLQALNMLLWAGYAHPVRPDGVRAEAAEALQEWVEINQLPLKINPICGSASRV